MKHLCHNHYWHHTAMISGILIVAWMGPLRAFETPVPDTTTKSNLTSLSLEELSNLEVTSVQKTPEKFLQAPAAI